jgi:photosystem II stability/assembly factor-like uncharacterized protein
MKTLHRRDFLKLAGLASASGVILLAPQVSKHAAGLFADPQIRFGRFLIRGTSHGTILSSSDDGKNWNQLVSFGGRHVINELLQRDEQIYAKLSLGRHDFWLRSADGRTWFTV